MNLHIITVNYQPGEQVSANIEYCDIDSVKQTFSVSGIVNADGEAIVKNVFKNKKLSIDWSI